MFFCEVPGLREMEISGRWKEIYGMILRLWNEDRGNVEYLLRLSAECWVILDRGLLTSREDVSALKRTLYDCYEQATSLKPQSAKLLFLFGYMLSLTPFHFYEPESLADNRFELYEAAGTKMLKEAYEAEPDELLYQVAFYGSTTKNPNGYYIANAKLKLFLNELFPNGTLIEQYFSDVFGM